MDSQADRHRIENVKTRQTIEKKITITIIKKIYIN